MSWTPSLRSDVDLTALPLDPRQGFLLAQVDGRTEVAALAAVTGFDPDLVTAMLEELVALGAVLGREGAAVPPAPPPPPGPERGPDREGAGTGTHRQLFETRLRHLPPDQRAALARSAQEPELSALCFDPMPKVVAALMENPRLAGVHARLVARHHPTGAGLEALAARAAFAMDPGVQGALLGNPVLPRDLYRRIWSGKRLLVQFQVASDRDCPEQTRAAARDQLRASFNQRPGEERVELILTTEGRCLAALTGLTVDGRTTALLCRRSYASTLLIQNIAAWSAAPPQLIAHLLRQDLVRRNPGLRLQLERHPNAPA